MRRSKVYALLLAGTLVSGCLAGPAYADPRSMANIVSAETASVDEAKIETEATQVEQAETETQDASTSDQADAAAPSTDTAEDANTLYADEVKEGAVPLKDADVEAGARTFSKRVLYTTYDQETDPKKYLSEEVTLNGDRYTLKAVGTPVQVKIETAVKRTLTHESEVFTGDGSDHEPEETVTDDAGRVYVLTSKELQTQTAEERSEEKESVVEYSGVEAGVQLPQKTNIDFTDVDTNQKVSATLDLKNEKVTKEYWVDTFEFPVTITGYDADVFELNGKEIPKDADLTNYASDFLEYLKLDPNSYKISKITWDGEPYVNAQGQMSRNARGYGSKYVKDISATYGGTVTLPAITGNKWVSVYTEDIPDDQLTVYTMAVDTDYEMPEIQTAQVETSQGFLASLVGYISAAYQALIQSFKEHPVATTVPFVLIAGLLAFLITRRVRNRCVYDKSMKCIYRKHQKATCQSCVHYRKRTKI